VNWVILTQDRVHGQDLIGVVLQLWVLLPVDQ